MFLLVCSDQSLLLSRVIEFAISISFSWKKSTYSLLFSFVFIFYKSHLFSHSCKIPTNKAIQRIFTETHQFGKPQPWLHCLTSSAWHRHFDAGHTAPTPAPPSAYCFSEAHFTTYHISPWQIGVTRRLSRSFLPSPQRLDDCFIWRLSRGSCVPVIFESYTLRAKIC